MSPQPAIVHVVDDDDSLRTAVMRLLQAAGYEVHGYASAGEFLAHRSSHSRPSCVVLDIRMPGGSGPDLQETLARLDPSLPIVFLTGYGDVPTSVRAMKAGAVDFLTKPVSGEQMLATVERAVARGEEARAVLGRLRVLRARYETLTPRERDVLALVVTGRLNKQIAAALGTSERTVKAHRGRIMVKMQVESLAELVVAAELLRAASQR